MNRATKLFNFPKKLTLAISLVVALPMLQADWAPEDCLLDLDLCTGQKKFS